MAPPKKRKLTESNAKGISQELKKETVQAASPLQRKKRKTNHQSEINYLIDDTNVNISITPKRTWKAYLQDTPINENLLPETTQIEDKTFPSQWERYLENSHIITKFLAVHKNQSDYADKSSDHQSSSGVAVSSLDTENFAKPKRLPMRKRQLKACDKQRNMLKQKNVFEDLLEGSNSQSQNENELRNQIGEFSSDTSSTDKALPELKLRKKKAIIPKKNMFNVLSPNFELELKEPVKENIPLNATEHKSGVHVDISKTHTSSCVTDHSKIKNLGQLLKKNYIQNTSNHVSDCDSNSDTALSFKPATLLRKVLQKYQQKNHFDSLLTETSNKLAPVVEGCENFPTGLNSNIITEVKKNFKDSKAQQSQQNTSNAVATNVITGMMKVTPAAATAVTENESCGTMNSSPQAPAKNLRCLRKQNVELNAFGSIFEDQVNHMQSRTLDTGSNNKETSSTSTDASHSISLPTSKAQALKGKRKYQNMFDKLVGNSVKHLHSRVSSTNSDNNQPGEHLSQSRSPDVSSPPKILERVKQCPQNRLFESVVNISSMKGNCVDTNCINYEKTSKQLSPNTNTNENVQSMTADKIKDASSNSCSFKGQISIEKEKNIADRLDGQLYHSSYQTKTFLEPNCFPFHERSKNSNAVDVVINSLKDKLVNNSLHKNESNYENDSNVVSNKLNLLKKFDAGLELTSTSHVQHIPKKMLCPDKIHQLKTLNHDKDDNKYDPSASKNLLINFIRKSDDNDKIVKKVISESPSITLTSSKFNPKMASTKLFLNTENTESGLDSPTAFRFDPKGMSTKFFPTPNTKPRRRLSKLSDPTCTDYDSNGADFKKRNGYIDNVSDNSLPSSDFTFEPNNVPHSTMIQSSNGKEKPVCDERNAMKSSSKRNLINSFVEMGHGTIENENCTGQKLNSEEINNSYIKQGKTASNYSKLSSASVGNLSVSKFKKVVSQDHSLIISKNDENQLLNTNSVSKNYSAKLDNKTDSFRNGHSPVKDSRKERSLISQLSSFMQNSQICDISHVFVPVQKNRRGLKNHTSKETDSTVSKQRAEPDGTKNCFTEMTLKSTDNGLNKSFKSDAKKGSDCHGVDRNSSNYRCEKQNKQHDISSNSHDEEVMPTHAPLKNENSLTSKTSCKVSGTVTEILRKELSHCSTHYGLEKSNKPHDIDGHSAEDIPVNGSLMIHNSLPNRTKPRINGRMSETHQAELSHKSIHYTHEQQCKALLSHSDEEIVSKTSSRISERMAEFHGTEVNHISRDCGTEKQEISDHFEESKIIPSNASLKIQNSHSFKNRSKDSARMTEIVQTEVTHNNSHLRHGKQNEAQKINGHSDEKIIPTNTSLKIQNSNVKNTSATSDVQKGLAAFLSSIYGSRCEQQRKSLEHNSHPTEAEEVCTYPLLSPTENHPHDGNNSYKNKSLKTLGVDQNHNNHYSSHKEKAIASKSDSGSVLKETKNDDVQIDRTTGRCMNEQNVDTSTEAPEPIKYCGVSLSNHENSTEVRGKLAQENLQIINHELTTTTHLITSNKQSIVRNSEKTNSFKKPNRQMPAEDLNYSKNQFLGSTSALTQSAKTDKSNIKKLAKKHVNNLNNVTLLKKNGKLAHTKTSTSSCFVVDSEKYHKVPLIKPKCWVNQKFYNHILPKFEGRYGFKARVKCEDFVKLLCSEVTSCIRSKKNWQKHVHSVKQLLSDKLSINSLVDFHVFAEQYLPEEFVWKLIDTFSCRNTKVV